MSPTHKTVKFLVELSRMLVGAIFVFSGFVKAVDPLGFAYKIQDYLVEMNLTVLFPLALPVAVIMVTAEFSLGVLPGSSRFVPSLVERDQLLCLPDPLMPA